MMTLKEISDLINCADADYSLPKKLSDCKILSLCHDSRRASFDCLFFCRRGAVSDGHMFAFNAYDNGARFFVVERYLELPPDALQILVENATEELKRLAIKFYGDPAKELTLIGITGTKGKTTTALSIYNIACRYGIMMGYIGTNGIYYCDNVIESINTTPDTLELQKNLRDMVECGITHVVIEVSSQALKQDRVAGLDFDICVFTNLYKDHIGGVEHPDMNDYMSCKRRLFTSYNVKHIVVNSDSPESKYMIDGVSCEGLVKVSSKGDASADIRAVDCQRAKNGINPGVSFKCVLSDEISKDIFIPLPGIYSVENGLLAIAVCMHLGIDIDFIAECMKELRIAGRFETVFLSTKPNSLFVIDYAHNGASLCAVLNSLRDYSPSRIICLFGSVGGRTFSRRRELGEAAGEYADVIIVTSDNPDNERPMDVINDINEALSGCEKPIYLIADREEAIKKAYELSQDGDMILLAGKGHETYQLIKGERYPFSERRILERIDKFALVMG